MQKGYITVGTIQYCIRYPKQLSNCIDSFLNIIPTKPFNNSDCKVLTIEQHPAKKVYSIHLALEQPDFSITEQNIIIEIREFLLKQYLNSEDISLSLKSAAASIDKNTILLPEVSKTGKTLMLAWLLSKGFRYETDSLTSIDKTRRSTQFINLPFIIHNSSFDNIVDFLKTPKNLTKQGDEYTCISVSDTTPTVNSFDTFPNLLLFANFSPYYTQLFIQTCPAAQCGLELMRCIPNKLQIKNHGFIATSTLARKTPALSINFGSLEQLEVLGDVFFHTIITKQFTPSELSSLIKPFLQSPKKVPSAQTVLDKESEQDEPIPAATPPGPRKKLTIGMTTYDDYDGVYFTIQALRLYHAETAECTEIIVIDNNPGGVCSRHLKDLEKTVLGYRYIPFADYNSTAVRDLIFRHASSDYVLVLDCHVLLVPGAIKKLIQYFTDNPNTEDLLQGPLLTDNLTDLKIEFNPQWQGGMYGTWKSVDPIKVLEEDSIDIPMQGLGLFGCKKDKWPGFNPRFRGFGGEEGYIHEKFRQQGGRTLCLPFLQWTHRFKRPLGAPYPLTWKDRIFNYMVGFKELNLDQQPIKEHFKEYLGEKAGKKLIRQVSKEISSPFFYFDAIYCITLDEKSWRFKKIKNRFEMLGIADRVRIFKAIETPENHHIGCALSHRGIVNSAKHQQLSNVLVFEDDALFLDKTIDSLAKSIGELKQQDWHLFYLGGHTWGQKYPYASNCSALLHATGLTCTHALVYNYKIYQRILDDLPESYDAMVQWIKQHHAIDQYLRYFDKIFLAKPVVSTQKELLPVEEKQLQKRFTLGDSLP